MNQHSQQKIKELIHEVGTDVGGKWVRTDLMHQFAELVVLECCRVLEHNHHDTISRAAASDFLKKHFGIQE